LPGRIAGGAAGKSAVYLNRNPAVSAQFGREENISSPCGRSEEKKTAEKKSRPDHQERERQTLGGTLHGLLLHQK
jgi:hypothetical protein